MGVFILRQENFRPSALPPRRASERGHHAKWIDHVLAKPEQHARSSDYRFRRGLRAAPMRFTTTFDPISASARCTYAQKRLSNVIAADAAAAARPKNHTMD